ncbi:MAG: hypothetical protein R2834_19855 [Rhodothermales bacterium]
MDETYRSARRRPAVRRDRHPMTDPNPINDLQQAWTDQWDTFVTPAMDAWTRLWNEALDTARMPLERSADRPRERRRPEHDPCGCGCKEGDCACRCCIGQADIVIYAYPGERRIVSMAIENPFRRQRDVTLELSAFDGEKDCPIDVKGLLAGETQFTLPACDEREILVAIEVGDLRQQGRVDTCCVRRADLRITGCDIRPVRIAVAVLPFTCDRYVIDCACGCC